MATTKTALVTLAMNCAMRSESFHAALGCSTSGIVCSLAVCGSSSFTCGVTVASALLSSACLSETSSSQRVEPAWTLLDPTLQLRPVVVRITDLILSGGEET